MGAETRAEFDHRGKGLLGKNGKVGGGGGGVRASGERCHGGGEDAAAVVDRDAAEEHLVPGSECLEGVCFGHVRKGGAVGRFLRVEGRGGTICRDEIKGDLMAFGFGSC